METLQRFSPKQTFTNRGSPLAATYWYHTPAGRFRTVVEAAEANDVHRRAIEHRIQSKHWPDFYKTPRKPETWWQTAPVSELTPLQLKRRRKWENERAAERNKKRRKFATQEELTEYRRQLASKVFNDPEYRQRQREAWQKYNDNLTEEDYKKRAQRYSENYWNRIEETIGIEKYKERQKKKLARYHRRRHRKLARKERRKREKLLREKNRRIEGIKIWRDTTNNHYKVFRKNAYVLYRICKTCSKEDEVYNYGSQYCSKWCANVGKSGKKWSKQFLEDLKVNGNSFQKNATMLGVSRGTLLLAYEYAGIEPNIRDYSQRLSTWLSRHGQLRPTKELSAVLKDDNPETGERYLPDEIEDYMDDLDDFFDGLD